MRHFGSAIAAAIILALLPSYTMAAPICQVSQAIQQRILFSICGELGSHPAREGKSCILPTTSLNIQEAVIFTAFIERCGKRDFAEQAYRGIARVYGTFATMARCTGVDLDIDGMIAAARSKEAANSAGRACPPAQSDAAKMALAGVVKFWQAETDSNAMALIERGIYGEAGVAVDAKGNVTEK